MEQQIDINILIETFKARLAQLEYELLIANTLLQQRQNESKDKKKEEVNG